MKRIINCVLAVLVSVGLTSCSTVQDNELQPNWEQRADNVYRTPVPQASRPAATNRPVALSRPKYERISEAEQDYIASHYGL